MGKQDVNGQQAEKKSGGKKTFAAIVVAALLGLGAYGGMKYYNNETEANKEKVTIVVSAETVTVNDQEQKLAEGQTWKKWLEEYFAKKDMDKTEVVVDFGYGDSDLTAEIKGALSDLKITTTEKQGGK
jgi:hypothetical protein